MTATVYSYPSIVTASISAVEAAGSVSVPGLEVGDVLLVAPVTAGSGENVGSSFEGAFERRVSVADEIQQTSGIDSGDVGDTILLVLMRGVS